MEILERAFKSIPGLALVFGIVGLLGLNPESELSAALQVFVIAWILDRLGSFLDGPFDMLYGPQKSETPSSWDLWRQERLFRFKQLEDRRQDAQRALAPPEDLYKTAVAKLSESGVQDIKVYSSLQYSKAARAFILPLLGVSIAFSLSQWPLTAEPFPAFLRRSHLLEAFFRDIFWAAANLRSLTAPGNLILCCVCIVLCIYYRVAHMCRLYELAAAPRRPSDGALVASE